MYTISQHCSNVVFSLQDLRILSTENLWLDSGWETIQALNNPLNLFVLYPQNQYHPMDLPHRVSERLYSSMFAHVWEIPQSEIPICIIDQFLTCSFVAHAPTPFTSYLPQPGASRLFWMFVAVFLQNIYSVIEGLLLYCLEWFRSYCNFKGLNWC